MSDWLTISLEEFCERVSDGTHDSPKPVEIGKPLVTSKNLLGGRLDISNTYNISTEDFEAINKRSKVHKGDVLLSMIGTVGQVAYIEDEPDFAIKNVGLLKVGDEYKAKWLYFYLSSPLAQTHIKERLRGTTQQYLPLGEIRKFTIKTPDDRKLLKSIVDQLWSLRRKIELNRQVNQTLEQMAQAIFKSWFVDFDPVRAKMEGSDTGLPKHIADLFPDELVESELGLVPKGWEVGSLATIMDIAGGTQPPAEQFIDEPQEGYIRLIQIRDYETDRHLTFVPHTSKLRTTTIKDIMIARYGASVGRICWGLDGAYNVALVRVVCEEHFREYLRTYLYADVFQLRLAQMSGRSAQAGFNKSDIASFTLVIPSKTILEIYQKITWCLREKMLQSKAENIALQNLRDSLLPKLLSGEIEVGEVA